MIRGFCFYVGLLSTFLFPPTIFAQENISLGEWRMHVSYNRIKTVAVASDKIFAASSNGIIILNKNDKSFVTSDKLNVLHGTGVSTIAYDESSGQLFVAYENGTFDVIRNNEARLFDPSQNTVLTGPKTIHNIIFQNALAYLSTDYGVLVFDLQRSEIKETWRDLGVDGSTLKIFGSTFNGDSIFLATETGVLAGDPDDNLLDFNKWKRMTGGDIAGSVKFITAFNNEVYVTLDAPGIISYSNGIWSKEEYLQGVTFSALNSASGNLLLSSGNKVWRVNSEGAVEEFSDDLVTEIIDVRQDAEGALWIGDAAHGLITNKSGTTESVIPNGPATEDFFDLAYHDNKIYLVSGGYSDEEIPLQREGSVNIFENGTWSLVTEPVKDITSVVFSPEGRMYLSSFGSGVLEKDNSASVLYDESNSTLINLNAPSRNVLISSLNYSTEGLWVANYGTSQSLHLLSAENSWESFSIPISAAKYPVKILSDFQDNVWMITNPDEGGGLVVFNKNDDESFYLTVTDGAGELPSSSVYSLAVDRDGYVWAGTAEGVAYFYDESSDAVKPIFENRFLLRDDKVTAIAVDGGNRKWMGTERGVWLFNPTGEVALANFNTANSPLLSNKIIDIEIHPITGEVFFATDQGVVSFRSDATESKTIFQQVKIFPNPVLQNFGGQVGISGLATDAIVKITDVSGKLIYQTVANGGTASWDVRDHQGRRVPTGVFLVFAVEGDGSGSIVGKIAVVN